MVDVADDEPRKYSYEQCMTIQYCASNADVP